LKVDGVIQQGAVSLQSLSYAFHILKVPVQIEIFQTPDTKETEDQASGYKKGKKRSHLK
jgi:hypothetical protein